MIVVDASVAVLALAHSDERGRRARAALAADPSWAVPEHWTIEVFSAIRGLLQGAAITEAVADAALHRLQRLTVEKVETANLLASMWTMRANVSAYDAPYVALAAVRNLVLVTADRPLARAAVERCRTEFIR